MNSYKRKEIVQYTKSLINSIMEWYTHGDAIDCDETRRHMNRDLDSVLPRVQEKFNLKKINRLLRARSDGKGNFVVRLEKINLN